MLWVLISTVHLAVCFCRVTYAFKSVSTLYNCLNVKEQLLAKSRREIWSLSECNWTRTHNHLVHKRILNYLAKLFTWLKWMSIHLWNGCGFEPSCSHCSYYSEHQKQCYKSLKVCLRMLFQAYNFMMYKITRSLNMVEKQNQF